VRSHLFSTFPIKLLNLSQSKSVFILTFVWSVASDQMKAEWSTAMKECGEQYVMTDGIGAMPWLCVDNLDYPLRVSKKVYENVLVQFVITIVVDSLTVREFGKGTGPILLDKVHCTCCESSLSQYPHAGIGNHDCGHSEDVGVRCGENKHK